MTVDDAIERAPSRIALRWQFVWAHFLSAAIWSLVVMAIAWMDYAARLKLPLTAIVAGVIVVGYNLLTAAAGFVYPKKIHRKPTRWRGFTYWRNRGSAHHRLLSTAERRIAIGGALLFVTVALFPPWLPLTARGGRFIAPLVPPPRRITRSSFDVAVNAAFRIDVAPWGGALLVVAIAAGIGPLLAKFLWPKREEDRRDEASTDKQVYRTVKIAALYLVAISAGAIVLRFRDDPAIVLEYGWIGVGGAAVLVAASLITRGAGSFPRRPPRSEVPPLVQNQ